MVHACNPSLGETEAGGCEFETNVHCIVSVKQFELYSKTLCQKSKGSWMLMAHTNNPSYLGG
jgi:hypothetical protein